MTRTSGLGFWFVELSENDDVGHDAGDNLQFFMVNVAQEMKTFSPKQRTFSR